MEPLFLQSVAAASIYRYPGLLRSDSTNQMISGRFIPIRIIWNCIVTKVGAAGVRQVLESCSFSTRMVDAIHEIPESGLDGWMW